tara:strand:- start:2370 stop:4394 length:2025 start_codon:yes stop_codon:yes gene_type:complete
MAKDSFNDRDISDLLNSSYLSIKVDREQRPLLDNYFMSALKIFKSEAGWPINAILTPDGRILWIDSFIDKNKFFNVLSGISNRWNKNPAMIELMAKQIESQLSLARKGIYESDDGEINNWPIASTNTRWKQLIPSLLNAAHKKISDDNQHDGPRFFRTHEISGLLDQYQRTKDPKLLKFIERDLDAILTSPSYDSINGGFHRYSVNKDWSEPHFEKMLYTQANMIRILTKIYSLTGHERYLYTMQQTIAMGEVFLANTWGYSSAISAFSDGGEGFYYQHHDLLVSSTSSNKYPLNTGSPEDNISHVRSQLVDFNYNPHNKLVSLKRIDRDWRNSKEFGLLEKYRNKKKPPNIDDKVIISWNSAYAIALLDAFDATGDREYLLLSRGILDRLWQYGKVDQKLYRSIFNGRASVKAQLEDYAWFAAALYRISIYQDPDNALLTSLENSKSFLGKGSFILDQLITEFGSQLLDTPRNDSDQWYQPAYNKDQELSSAKSIVFEAMMSGYRLTHNVSYKQIADHLKDEQINNQQNLQENYSFVSIIANEINPIHFKRSFFANGNGDIEVTVVNGKARIAFRLNTNWHIYANQTTNDRIIKTEVNMLPQFSEVTIEYPDAVIRKLSFMESPEALYEDSFEVTIDNLPNSVKIHTININLQACTDNLCLTPENIIFNVLAN